MAEMNFEIKGSHGQIAASTFERAVAHAISLLGQFDSAISGKPRGSLRWYIEKLSSNGNLSIDFRSKLKPASQRSREFDFSSEIASSFLNGFQELETKCETPAYLSEFGLRKAGDLAGLIGRNGATGFQFSSKDQTVDITNQTSANIEKLLPIKRKAIGSVEGTLEGVNLHRDKRVTVYETFTKKGVLCEFTNDVLLDRIKQFLGKKVTVFGVLQKNIKGDTLRVKMDSIEPFMRTKKAAPDDEAAWADPLFARTLSTATYIRKIRGG